MAPSIENFELGGRKIKVGDILITKDGLLYEISRPNIDPSIAANHAAAVIITPVGKSSTVTLLDMTLDKYEGIVNVEDRTDWPRGNRG